MLRVDGLLNIHHLQRLEDIRHAHERFRLSSLLYRRTCFPALAHPRLPEIPARGPRDPEAHNR